MNLGNKTIGQDFITICEAGSTTRGDRNIAKQLATAAKEAGVDAIKFILSDPDELIAQPIDYEGQDLGDVIRGYQMSVFAWEEVIAHCKKIELPYFFSVGTIGYIDLAEKLGNPIYKVSAWDSRNYFLIDTILKTGKPLMFDISALIPGEVCNILEHIGDEKQWSWAKDNIAFVYESHSPNLDEINLHSIRYLRDRFGLPVGYSADWRDMCPDMWAVKNGACLIEKRVRLDDTEGHHHDKALNPMELAEWVKMMHNPSKIPWSFSQEEQAVGRYGLFPSLVDVANKQKYFTSLCFSRDVKQGEIITREMTCAKRPGNGLSPAYLYLFEGKPAARDYKRNEILTYDTI
jgi:sialic acid synthase SpsE